MKEVDMRVGNSRILIFALGFLLAWVLSAQGVWADEEIEIPPAGDESGMFGTVTPDVLLLMDLSGSMIFNPLGDDGYPYGSSLSCKPDTSKCSSSLIPYVTCSNGFCSKSKTNCNVNCSRLAIAKRALFQILDDDNNNIINKADSDSLNIRIGFMRFKDINDYKSGNDTGGDYTKGAIKLVTKISELGKETGTSYSLTYCGNSGSCASTATTCTTGECIVGENAAGGTPLASALREAKKYLDDHKAADPAKECRAKFVIMVTDGADTFACGGNGAECQSHMYIRRREVVAAVKELADAGYRVFVIGFGAGMPDYLKNTLEWAAFYGKTDNPSAPNTGTVGAYPIGGSEKYPQGVSGCAYSSAEPAACYTGGSSYNTDNFKATNYDPGYLPLSGYAFLAENADQLSYALRTAISTIRTATYSFTDINIQYNRTKDENFMYEASFEPMNDPFWIGHLKRYSLLENGDPQTTSDWDAGEILKNRTAARTIYTLKNNTLVRFNSTNVSDQMLDISESASCTSLCESIINFIHGGESDPTYSFYRWKLGDIYHSSPISIATPNAGFYDQWDQSKYSQYFDANAQACKSCNSCGKAFNEFLCSHIRTSKTGGRIILVGANDGQLHAFKAGEISSGGGSELWSFIPPNLLSRLKKIAHDSHPSNLSHEYFVDGPLSSYEVWIPSSGTGTIGSTKKSPGEWYTYLIVAEGRGGINSLWSSSTSCDSDLSPYYRYTRVDPDSVVQETTLHPNYCGYYVLDVTDTTNPVFKWRLGGNQPLSESDAIYLGQAWSKMVVHRVRVNNNEKWVGFIGGGYSGNSCGTTTTCDKRGKGFFVVDMADGSILKSFTQASSNVSGAMNFDLVAEPLVVDTDLDGFADTAYIGDTGGNMWRFKFCLAKDGTSCNENSWSGNLLFSKN